MGTRRFDGLLRELRKLVFGACCALGALGGLWTGIWANAEIPAGGSLFGDLGDMLKPMLAHFGVGLGVGVAAGLLICLTVLKPRRPR
jgi:hypothetical protein